MHLDLLYPLLRSMGKRAKSFRSPHAAEGGVKPAVKGSPSARITPRSGRWLARVAAMLLVPLLAFLALEGALRLVGFGYPTSFFIRGNEGTLTTNPKFAWQFYPRENATSPTPLIVTRAKPPGTKRVVVLGESAAAGTPDPAFSFSRMLELMFEQENPSNHVEIINMAMRGIDTHIVRRIAAESLQLSPDLLIVYAGNNEVIGLHSPDPNRLTFFSHPAFIAAQHAVKRTRVSQFLSQSLRGFSKGKPAQDMEFLRKQRLAFDDPKRELIYSNYRRNLEKICELAAGAGARVVLCSVAVNLHDFAPLGSLHRRDLSAEKLTEWQRHFDAGAKAESEQQHELALKHFRAAAEIDDRHAELNFRMARCAEARGSLDEARTRYSLARDWDALQFRTDSRMNQIVREVAARGNTHQMRFVDVENAFAQSPLAENGLPGNRLFQEHVHFLFQGDYELARTLWPEVRRALGMSASNQALQLNACAAKLGYTKVEEANVLSAVAQMTAKPPFLDQLEHGVRHAALQRRVQELFSGINRQTVEQSRATYLAALKARPDDWMLRLNYARLLTDLGEHASSIPEYEQVIRRFPQQKAFRVMFGMALLQVRRGAEATREFTAALEIDPEFAPAKQALARLHAAR